MKILKTLLLLFFFTVVFASVYAWVNIWVPKNAVGVLYGADDSAPRLIQKKKFDWYWQRVLLGTTQLISVPITTKIDETLVSFYLPNTEYYSGLLKVSPESFKSTTKIKLLYHINTDTLISYLQSYYTMPPIHYESILLALSEQIKTTVFSTIRQESFDTLEVSDSTTYADWDTMMASLTEFSIKRMLEQKYPVIVEKVLFETIEIPNIETYMYIDNNNPLEALQSGNENANSDALWLQQYIQFIKKLGDATKDNPHSVEIIKALTPAHVRDSLR